MNWIKDLRCIFSALKLLVENSWGGMGVGWNAWKQKAFLNRCQTEEEEPARKRQWKKKQLDCIREDLTLSSAEIILDIVEGEDLFCSSILFWGWIWSFGCSFTPEKLNFKKDGPNYN